MVETRSQFTLGFAFLAINLIVLMLLAPTSGYFDATFTSTSIMFKNDTIMMNSNGWRIKKVNRTHVLTGTLETFTELGNDFQCVSYFSKKVGNEYRRLPYKIGPYKFCQYVDEEKYFVDDMRKKSNFPAKGTCPWPKQIYKMDGYIIKLDNIPQVVSSGDYYMEVQFSKNGVLLNGLQFFVKLEHV